MNLHTLRLNRLERYLAAAPFGVKLLIVAAVFGALGLIVGSAGAVIEAAVWVFNQFYIGG
jgi:hypothetical protein